MNLHAVVRPVIPVVHPDEHVTWYRSTGQQAVDWGQVTRSYAAGVQLVAQVQSEGDAALYYANRAGENSIIRKFYLMASPDTPPASIVRPEARSGDFIRRRDGRFWYVDAALEDFSANANWVCVRGVLQDTIPAELQAVVDAETAPEPEPSPDPDPGNGGEDGGN